MNVCDKSPVNKTAALVISKGVDWKPNKKVQVMESENPLPMRDCNYSMKGMRRGRLVVLGLYDCSRKVRLVCRCDCGMYVVRNPKAIRNKKNNQDRCEKCRHLAFLKREEHYRRTGKDVDINDF